MKYVDVGPGVIFEADKTDISLQDVNVQSRSGESFVTGNANIVRTERFSFGPRRRLAKDGSKKSPAKDGAQDLVFGGKAVRRKSKGTQYEYFYVNCKKCGLLMRVSPPLAVGTPRQTFPIRAQVNHDGIHEMTYGRLDILIVNTDEWLDSE